MAGVDFRRSRDFTVFTSWFYAWVQNVITDGRWDLYYTWVQLLHFTCRVLRPRGDEWSLRAFASMPSTAIFLRARAEIKNLLCELASNAKIWGARASEHSFKFCEQLKILMDRSSPLDLPPRPNCDSDGPADNKRQRTVVWLIYHRSECQDEDFFVNFPYASENVSCQWALVDPPERASRYTSFMQLCTIRGRPENEVVRHVNLVPGAFTRLPSRSLIFCYISMNGMLEHCKALSPQPALSSSYSLYTWVKRDNVIQT